MIKTNLKNYESGNRQVLKFEGEEIHNVEIAYDKGRLIIFVNDRELDRTNLAGDDFSIEVSISQ